MTTRSRPEGAATRQPGQWPAGCTEPSASDAAWMRLQAERARREMVLASIRTELTEQPSPRAVRAVGRRWCRSILGLVEDIVTNQARGGDQ